MRVALATPFYLPYQIGGVELHVKNLAKTLSMMGHEVRIFATTDNATGKHLGVEETRTVDGLKVDFQISSFVGTINPDFSDFDVIHIHNYTRIFTDALISKWHKKKPIVLTLHGSLLGPLYDDSLISPTIKVLHDKMIARRLLRNVTKIIALSANEKEFLVKRFAIDSDSVAIIPNGLPAEAFSQRKDVSMIPGTEYPYICTYSRLAKVKSIDRIIEVLGELPDNIHYVVGGRDYGELRNLERLAVDRGVNHRVHFVGELTEEQKYSLMANSIAFVLPSRFEMQPISVLEAMAQHVAVVATKVGGVPEVIENGVDGLLYDWNNTKEARQQIMKLVEDEEFRSSVKLRAATKSLDFTWTRVGAAINSVYDNAIRKGH